MKPEGGTGCYLIGRRCGDRLTLLSGSSSSLLIDEGRAVLVFGDPSVMRKAFRITEGLGPEWDVIGHRPTEVVEALEISAASGIWYVEFDPRPS